MRTRAIIAEAVALAGILLLHALLMRAYFVPVLTGSDPDGYHGCAREVADRGRLHRIAEDDFAFIGRMWVVNERGEYYPKYPPFYPAVAGLAMRLFGPNAGLAVNPVAAWLCVLGIYLLVRARWPSGRAALLAAFALACNPMFNQLAARPTSHITSLLFMIWGFAALFLALRAERNGTAVALGIAAGVMAGVPTGIRYSEALLAAPLLAAVLLAAPGRRIRLAAALASGLAIPWGLLAIFHTRAFGAPWRTGYALTGEQTGFAGSYFADNIRFYFGEFLMTGLGPLSVLAAFGLAETAGRSRRETLVYLLWIFPLFTLYLFYYWAPEPRAAGYLRFLLPIFVPCILLAAVWLAGGEPSVLPGGGRRAGALVVAFLICQGGWGAMESIRAMETIWQANQRSGATRDFAVEQIPEGAVVVASGRLLNTLDFERRWRVYEDALFNRAQLQRLVDNTLEPGPNALQKERAERLQALLLEITPAEYRRKVRALIADALAEGRPVYVLGNPSELRRTERFFESLFRVETVATHAPELPAWRWLASGKPREPGRRPEPTVQAPPTELRRLTEKDG